MKMPAPIAVLVSPFISLVSSPGDWSQTNYERWSRDFWIFVFYAGSALVAAMAGYVASRGEPVYVLIYAGLVVGAIVISSRQALTWFVIIGGLVATGLAQLYVPGARYVRYVIPLAALVLLLHAAFDRIRYPAQGTGKLTPLAGWAIMFLVVAVASAAINAQGMTISLNGLRGYFQMWPFLVALLLIRWAPEELRSWPKGILAIGLLQLPFVIHQYFVLVPRRVGLGDNIVPVDIVVGTF